jgi:hypothetical protein
VISPIIALFASVGVIAALFSFMPPRRAAIAGYIGAWLFLPQASVPVLGYPDLTKSTAASLGILLGILFFDAGRLVRFRPHWIDIPAIVLICVPMAASLSNDLGAYDGASACLAQFVNWGLPYFIGRLYIDSFPAMRDLALGIFIGGLIYVPLCLIEVRMSPQLHRWVYGYHQHEFIQTIRGDSYRPMVFMQHGLMVAMWMASATIVAFWLWLSGSVRKIFGLPTSVFAFVFLGVTVLCKSFGALGLLLLALPALWLSARLRTVWIILLIVALPAVYMYLRVNDMWDGESVAELIERISPDRADSLRYRLNAEAIMTDKAMEQQWFGWGGWGRSLVYNEWGRAVAETDGLWIITLGTTGLVGLAALTAVVCLPVLLFTLRVRPLWWSMPAVAPAAVLAMLLLMHSIDNLVNAMVNPTYIMIAGGLGTLFLAVRKARMMAPVRAEMMQRMRAMAEAHAARVGEPPPHDPQRPVRYPS